LATHALNYCTVKRIQPSHNSHHLAQQFSEILPSILSECGKAANLKNEADQLFNMHSTTLKIIESILWKMNRIQ
jgi:hypothetical protein